MKKIFRRLFVIVPCILAIHFAMIVWDIERVEAINAPTWTLGIPWLSSDSSRVSIGFGYVVTEREYFNSSQSDVDLVREYKLKHWVFPWKVAFAGQPRI